MDIDRKIRQDIVRHMQRRHITQQELAERLDISPQYLSDVLTGRRGRLPKSLAKLLGALHLELTVKASEDKGRTVPPELSALLDAAGPLKALQGRGRPVGSDVRLQGGAEVSGAVVDERDARNL